MRTDFVVGTCVVQEDKILLIHHKKSGLWLHPGGHVDKDEVPDDAAIRELFEETGLKGRLLDLPVLPLGGNTNRILALPFHVNVHSVRDSIGQHDHCCFFYLCGIDVPADIELNKGEIHDAKWLSLDELNSASLSPDILLISKLALERHRTK